MTGTKPSGRRPSIVAALAGGWVADAASLGLHWLYNSERIREVGGDEPEFLLPKAEYFQGGFGYFAHEGKQVGDISHCGAATVVLTDSLWPIGAGWISGTTSAVSGLFSAPADSGRGISITPPE